jgi:hypothetical protein
MDLDKQYKNINNFDISLPTYEETYNLAKQSCLESFNKINNNAKTLKLINNDAFQSEEEEKTVKDIKISSNLVRDLICILMNLKTTKNISEEERKAKNNSIAKVYKSIREKAKKYKDTAKDYKNLSTLIDSFYEFTSIVQSSTNNPNKGNAPIGILQKSGNSDKKN